MHFFKLYITSKTRGFSGLFVEIIEVVVFVCLFLLQKIIMLRIITKLLIKLHFG